MAALLMCCYLPASGSKNNKDEVIKISSVKLPSRRRTYFNRIDTKIIEGVENGSPDSLRKAMLQLRQSTNEYEESEVVLMSVAAQMMEMAWPSEKIDWDVFPAATNNPYIGALDSAKKGVFDSSTGNVDFLTILLPAFVLFENGSDKTLYDSCELAIATALAVNKKSVIANYLMAVLQALKGNYRLAEPYLEDIYKECPDVKEIALAYSEALRENGKIKEATEIINKMGSDSSDINVLKENAYLAFDKKDFDSAEYYVARVLQQTPNDLEFVLFRAKILIEQGDYIHAVSLLDMYEKQDDKNLEYLLLRAKVQLDWSKNTNAATKTIEEALKLYPDNKDALLIAAKISSITEGPVDGRYADQLAALVLEEQPENREAMNYALDGFMQRKNWNEAYKISKILIEDDNVSGEIINKYVNVCVEKGKKQEAYDYAKKMHNKNPDDEEILKAYILAYSVTGDRNSVLKYINSLLPKASQKIKSYLYYRRSFLQTSEDAALADLRSCLISNPRNSEALFRLYELYYQKGDYRKAQYYLRQVVAINPNDSSLKQLNESLSKLIK